ncbi:MAG: hypothetical protein J5787_01650 [Alphaproteobacteria bacterium]|nr:hypothetical protein [Alphaproteobacteria bacterium]
MADPTQISIENMSLEDMMAAVAEMESENMRAALVADFKNRIKEIMAIRGEYRWKKYNTLPPDIKKQICEKVDMDNPGHYCVASYTASVRAALRDNDPELDNALFPKTGWGAQINTVFAINSVRQNKKHPEYAEAGSEIPEGKTLRDVLKEGNVPIGSMIIVHSDNSTSGGHCVMFMGLDKKTGEPLYTCGNADRIEESVSSWSDQTTLEVNYKTDGKTYTVNMPYIINTQKLMEIERRRLEHQRSKGMTPEEYYAAHKEQLDAYIQNHGGKVETQPTINKDTEKLQAVEKETLEQKDPPKKEEKKEGLPKKESPELQPEKKGEAKEGEEGVFSEGKVSVTGNGTTNTAAAPEPKKSFWKRLGERLRNFDNRVRGWLGLPQKEHKPEVQPQPAQTTEPKKSFWKRMGDGLRNFDNWVRDRLGMERKGPKPEVQPQPAQTTEPKGAKKVLQDIGKSLSYAGRKIGDNFRWLRRRILERVDRKANLKRTPFENFNASLHSQLKGFQRHSTMRTLMRSAAESERTSTVERSSFLHRGKER